MTAAATDLGAIVADLELGPGDIPVLELADLAPGRVPEIGAAMPQTGALLVASAATPDDEAVARLRDALWPDVHVSAIYRIDANGGIRRDAIAGTQRLDGTAPGPTRTVLFTRNHDQALGRATTVAKFDMNAEGWNGIPGTPTYGHFRWMRRLLAVVGRPSLGTRTLDAGCGAGWVGVEAAKLGAMASAFDPSPAMVEIAKRNAHEVGVDLDARVGFVEDVPFTEPFELVLNSGVISFAPDPEVYLDNLDALVKPGGVLVIGDLNPASSGFRRRRRRPLLPAREMNGLRRVDVETRLAQRGYTTEGRWYYQITFPVPELMALSEQRAGGFLCGMALLANKAATALDHAIGSPLESRFDSWILRARKAG